jgi:hypothetical protein
MTATGNKGGKNPAASVTIVETIWGVDAWTTTVQPTELEHDKDLLGCWPNLNGGTRQDNNRTKTDKAKAIPGKARQELDIWSCVTTTGFLLLESKRKAC